jgi:hypothetical protein
MIRIIILAALTLALMCANVFFGAIDIPADDVWGILSGNTHGDEALEYIVLGSRVPQAVTALLAGAGLAASGLMLQTVFRNPLAGPSILGITSGASLGVALVILFFGGMISIGAESLGGNIAVTIGALAGSFIVMGMLIMLSARIRSNLTLLIAGMMTGYLACDAAFLTFHRRRHTEFRDVGHGHIFRCIGGSSPLVRTAVGNRAAYVDAACKTAQPAVARRQLCGQSRRGCEACAAYASHSHRTSVGCHHGLLRTDRIHRTRNAAYSQNNLPH